MKYKITSSSWLPCNLDGQGMGPAPRCLTGTLSGTPVSGMEKNVSFSVGKCHKVTNENSWLELELLKV